MLQSAAMAENSVIWQWLARQKWVALVAGGLRRLGIHLVWVNQRDLTISPTLDTDLTGLEIRCATSAECLAACADQELQLDASFVRWAFAAGAICHGAFIGDQLVAYAWRTQQLAPHRVRVQVQVGPGFSYGFKAFTKAEYRGRGLYPAIADAERQSCIDAGVTKGVSFTEMHNSASLRADLKFGNRILGAAGFVEFGSFLYTFHDANVRRTGFRFIPP